MNKYRKEERIDNLIN